MKIAVVVITALISGCVTTSRIVPAGTDTYMISAANDACANCAPPEIRAAEQASAYCEKLGKTMSVRDSKEQTFDIGFGHRVTVTFQCK